MQITGMLTSTRLRDDIESQAGKNPHSNGYRTFLGRIRRFPCSVAIATTGVQSGNALKQQSSSRCLKDSGTPSPPSRRRYRPTTSGRRANQPRINGAQQPGVRCPAAFDGQEAEMDSSQGTRRSGIPQDEVFDRCQRPSYGMPGGILPEHRGMLEPRHSHDHDPW